MWTLTLKNMTSPIFCKECGIRLLTNENGFSARMDTDHYTVIAPVPLHPVRLRAHGFNQAQLLAESLCGLFRHAPLTTALTRIRPTRTRSRLNGPLDRQDNVRGAFTVDRGVDFTGHRILLIDDVVTTGGTVAECSKALLRAGAKHVDILAFALALGQHT